MLEFLLIEVSEPPGEFFSLYDVRVFLNACCINRGQK